MDEKLIEEVGVACRRCYEVCRQTLVYYADGFGDLDTNQFRLLLDCAGACETTTIYIRIHPDFLQSGSERCSVACRNCAKIFQDIEDELIEECVSICKECAELCEKAVASDESHPSPRNHFLS